MAFEIQRSKRSLPGKSGGVLTNYDFGDMGMGQLGRSLGKLGQAFENKAIADNRLEAENQFSESERQAKERLDLFEDEVKAEIDTSLYGEMSKQVLTDMAQYAPKNKLANRAYQRLLNRLRTSMPDTVRDVKRARGIDEYRANVAVLMAQGKFKAARKAIRKGVNLYGAFTKEEAAKEIADSRIEEKELNRNANIQELISAGKAQGTLEKALEVVPSAGLQLGMEKADITFALERVKDHYELEEIRKKEENDASETEMYRRIQDREGYETFVDDLRAKDLDATTEKQLFEGYQAKLRALSEGDNIISDEPTRRRLVDEADSLDPATEHLQPFLTRLQAEKKLSQATKDEIQKAAEQPYRTAHADLLSRGRAKARDLSANLPDPEKRIDQLIELELVTDTAGMIRVRQEVAEEISLIRSNARYAEDAISEWFLDPDNIGKPIEEKVKQEDLIIGAYRRKRDEGLNTLRKQRLVREARPVPEHTLEQQLYWLESQGLSKQQRDTYRKIMTPFHAPKQNPVFSKEHEYDTNKKEIGVKLQDGSLLKIGDEFEADGWLMMYVGDREAEKIRQIK